jgi:hypothetical protein
MSDDPSKLDKPTERNRRAQRNNPLKPMKLFPRNLTAHAAEIVRGNPVTSRPESGVENCWPGLEFDHRNIEKFFFPGLVFEYHDARGTILREFDPGGLAAKYFKASDIEKGIYLAFVQGNIVERSGRRVLKRSGRNIVEHSGHAKPEQRVFSFAPPAGLENWRVVRDFEPGPVAVALCDKATYDLVLADNYSIDDMISSYSIEEIKNLFAKRRNRREQGLVLLFAERARYLTADGVIDPGVIPPGSLTRSTCSPWQHDFAECGCFFWASNKPDMVANADQPMQILNFQRRDRSGDAKRTPTDWILKDKGKWEKVNILDHVDIINHFSSLKFVIAGRETDDYVPPVPAGLPPKQLLRRKEIIERLKVLAAVEHALCVEYLYAYYSLKLPAGSGPRREPWKEPVRPPQQSPEEARIFTASDEVLRVAIDEMRHFRWVNELLIEFGERWVLDRACIIGIDFPEQEGFKQPFELKPLTRDQLAWFIKVEKASPNHDKPGTIDGMYIRILRSIEEGSEFQADIDQRDRLAQFVKMIIDEGVDHYHRFTRVKEALDGLPEDEYLRVMTEPQPAPEGSPEKTLQDAADSAYIVLLHALDFVFRQDRQQRGALLEAARRAMYIIDEACRRLSERHFGSLFTRPPTGSITAVRTANDVGDALRPRLQNLRVSGHPDLIQAADRMEGKLDELTGSLEAAAKKS